MARPRVGQRISLRLRISRATINLGYRRSGRTAARAFVIRSITLDDRRWPPTPRRSSYRAGSAARRTARDRVVANDNRRRVHRSRAGRGGCSTTDVAHPGRRRAMIGTHWSCRGSSGNRSGAERFPRQDQDRLSTCANGRTRTGTVLPTGT